MLMYNLIEYSNYYSKTSRSLWQYYKNPFLNNNGSIVNFTGANHNKNLNLNKK